jgi:hypothetical protein
LLKELNSMSVKTLIACIYTDIRVVSCLVNHIFKSKKKQRVRHQLNFLTTVGSLFYVNAYSRCHKCDPLLS